MITVVEVMATDVALHSRRKITTDSHNGPLPIQTQRTNPLPARVSTILSASYTDSDIRDAVSLLDTRGLENSAETRRQLRLDVQNEVIESNGAIIKEFGQIAEQLKSIGNTITNLNDGCEQMKRHISAAHRETAPVLEEASELMRQKEQVETKQHLLEAFKTHFVISDDDISILVASSEPVDNHFFALLARAKSIQNDCETLLGTENQRLGLEIMEHMSKTVNQAFQKLYRWIQREFKSLNLENPQINTSIRRTLRVLAERPSLFQSCLDLLAEARESVLSDAFITALTGVSAGGEEDHSVKPIELVAHDPLRYVGDILAWTHSATVSEKEALEVLFISEGDEIAKEIQAGRDNEPWNRIYEQSHTFDGTKALHELVDRDIAGVAKLLRQRIGQVIQSHEEILMAYKLANILQLYHYTFSKLLGDDSVLLESLKTLEESALKQFLALVRDQVAALQADTQAPTSNLSPPDFLQEALEQLTAIMKTYETSFIPPESRAKDFEPILVESFDPFISKCETIAKELESPGYSIFTLNCLLFSKSVLEPCDFTQDRIARITKIVSAEASMLIEYQHSYFREKSGLQPLIHALEGTVDPLDDLKAVRKAEPFQLEALASASQALDDFLPSALMDALENLKHLQSSKFAREITEEAAERFCSDFERIEEILVAVDELPGESVESLRALFPRTSGEIRVLLS